MPIVEWVLKSGILPRPTSLIAASINYSFEFRVETVRGKLKRCESITEIESFLISSCRKGLTYVIKLLVPPKHWEKVVENCEYFNP